MEKEIKERIKLLDADGHIPCEGWARHPYWEYRRKDIHYSPYRIKEWDYYQIISHKDRYVINLTFSDLGLFSLISVSYIDFDRKGHAAESALKFLTKNRMGLSENPEDDYSVTYANEKITLSIIKKGSKRQIIANVPSLLLPDGKKGLLLDAVIHDEKAESMNIATSWKEDRTRFYYNEKRGPMRVSGKVIRDMDSSSLDSSLALLDWGRGVWLRSSTWLWSAITGYDGGNSFMINLGYGFTDRTPASENCIIYDGTVNKLEEVEIIIPELLDKDKWILKDKKGLLYLEMTPFVNRRDYQDYKLIVSKQDQVFGLFSGYFTLSNGRKVEIKDTMGFAERVYNKW